VVVGGSQAGLATAWHLARHHLRFVVLEAGPEIGQPPGSQNVRAKRENRPHRNVKTSWAGRQGIEP
jgi:flavin-dependent dehydrogenase